MLNKLWKLRGNPPIDEHDEPTEPLPRTEIDAFVPTLPNPIASPEEQDVPSPKTDTHPFPHRFIEEPPVQGNPPQTPVPNSVYPVLPAIPGGSSNNAAVGPGTANSVAQRNGVRRNIIPLAVGMCFVAIQMLLLVRFLLKLLNISPDTLWVEAIYGVSNVFVLPFHALFLQLAIPQFFTVELYTLLAIVGYSIVSRIIVHTLKVLLKTR